MLVLFLIVAIAFAIFYGIINADIVGYLKFFLVVVEMVLVGQLLIWRYKLSGEYGLILLKSKRGLDIINHLAKYENLWRFLSDAGAVMSYGFLSLVLMSKNVSWKSLITGLFLLTVIFGVVAPFVLPFLINTIGFSAVEKTIQQNNAVSDIASLSIIIIYAGGLFLLLLLSLLGYGVFIISALLSTIFHGTEAISKAPPGGTFLLPGINLPFFEGIAALVIILVVHEGAHAILARIAKIPVQSSGIALFGVLPIGAFVEPDENKLKKLEATKQTRVLVAGSTANLLTSILFFIIFFGFFSLTADYREQGLLVLNGIGNIENNTIIHSANGQEINPSTYSKMNLPKNSEVVLQTNKGEITAKTNDKGMLGIVVRPLVKDSIFAKYTSPILDFIYMLLGLTFSLNFVIGSVNLLPLPFFDGYRTLEVNIQNKLIVKALMALTLAAFIANFLPWFFVK